MELNDIFEELKTTFEMLKNKIKAQDNLVNGLKQENNGLKMELRKAETQKDEALRKLSKFKKLMGEIND